MEACIRNMLTISTAILIKDDRATYEYDEFNRLERAETFSGDIQINHYDAEGLRYEMEENGRLVSFIFRGREVVAEESKEDTIRYIRTGELLASDAESARTYYHYAADELGSITYLVDDESVLNHYEYDAFGNLTVCEEKVANRFKYTGQQYDPIMQQYYLRARYYNPVVGRFTQEDAYRGDGLNLYAYCHNNPVSYIDPTGYCGENAGDMVKNTLDEQDVRVAGKAEDYWDDIDDINQDKKTSGMRMNLQFFASKGNTSATQDKFDKLLNSDYYKNHPGYDCSEIAQDFLEAANQQGKIYRIEGKNGYVYGYEYGAKMDYYYHEVYSDDTYIYDPRYSNEPVLKNNYFKALSDINPDGFDVFEKKD